jgi:thiol-disulfide isomerase/thioredoxin
MRRIHSLEVQGDKPAIIDFYATWCGPGRPQPLSSTNRRCLQRQDRRYKVDVDKEQELAALFGIRSIPSYCSIQWRTAPDASWGKDAKQMEQAVQDCIVE